MAKAPPKAPTPVKTKEDPFKDSTHLVDDVLVIDKVIVNEDRPNIVKVKHKVTGKEFEVSRKYYETYIQVLDLV